MVKRGVIVARMRPGGEEAVAAIFAASDATDLPRKMRVRHRSLFLLEDVYVHLVEMDEDFDQVVAGHRDHALFKQISKDLEPYIQPYNPATWKSPKDATAREFYAWDNLEVKPGPCRRGVIVARMRSGCEEKVAAIFAASDATDLPRKMRVRHRSLFLLEDVYVHLVEMDEDFDQVVAGHRDHALFKQISKDLEPYIQPYNPATWKSPKDATAREFYSWDNPDSSDTLYQRGLAFYRAGNYARCRDCVNEVLATEANHASSLILKGVALVELGDEKEAVDTLQKAVQVAPDDAEAWRQLGIALTTIGERKQAVESLRASLERRPDQVPVLIDLGNLLFMMGRVEEAITALQRARQLRQGDLPILRNLADMYASVLRSEEALATTLEILELRPDDVLANCDAAWLLLQLKRLDEAAATFRKLRRIDPEQEHELYAVHGLVMTEIKRHNWRKALDLAIEATRLDRFDLTTTLLSFISGKLFGKTGSAVSEKDLNARFASVHWDHRRLHAE